MSFKTRNMYYLRISEKSVLPVYVYLDERHLEWMSDQVLQHVLSDLRPRILPKLMAEVDSLGAAAQATSKKATVDTYRGDTYQFCYFLRRTEPHSVVIKTRNYVARTPKRPSLLPPTRSSTSYKRKGGSTTGGGSLRSTKKRRTKRREVEAADVGDSEISEEERTMATRKAKTKQDAVINVDEDDIMDSNDEEYHPEEEVEIQERSDQEKSFQHDTFDLTLDEEEKPKPALQLRYQGFNIYGRCLCIVVEPWPAARSSSRAPQEFGGISNQKAIQKQGTQAVPTIPARAETPLFLADDDPAEMGPPEPVATAWSDLETMDDSSDDSEMGGMMAFSQALHSVGDNRPGAVDDDEMDGAVLFGDADEARQL